MRFDHLRNQLVFTFDAFADIKYRVSAVEVLFQNVAANVIDWHTAGCAAFGRAVMRMAMDGDVNLLPV